MVYKMKKKREEKTMYNIILYSFRVHHRILILLTFSLYVLSLSSPLILARFLLLLLLDLLNPHTKTHKTTQNIKNIIITKSITIQ